VGDAVTGDPRASAGLVTVAFANEGDYHAWHDAECAARGVPFPGHNQATGEPEVLAQWTTAVVAPVVDDGYWCVTVTAEQVAADPVLKGLEVWTFKNPTPVPPSAYEVPLPPTWTDPATDITYDTATGEPV
jgi:hypothetical protein